MGAEPAGFREYVQARSPALLRTAWMLTGNAATAEDLRTVKSQTAKALSKLRDAFGATLVEQEGT
jgi:hypothetical protein